MKKLLLILLGIAVPVVSFAAGEKPGPVAYVTIQTRDLTVEFAGDRAWTISRIEHRGQVITGRTGFYGTVFSPEGGKWIGTGHNEGGVEKVGSAVLTVDGRECALTDKAVYRGGRAELRKQSMMGPLKLEASYIVTDDRVIEGHRYEATEEVKIGTLYGFMHPFVPGTTGWMAEKTDGTLMEGNFDNQGGHKVESDVKWTAIHDPTTKRVTLVWYPVPLAGQGPKTFYWDKTVYHKLYNQLYSHSTVAKGAKFEAKVMVTCAESEETVWKEKARAMAAEMRVQP